MNNCIHLHFDYDPIINKEIFLSKPPEDFVYMTLLNMFEITNPRFILELHKLKITLAVDAELFYTKQNSTGVLHRDVSRHGPDTVLNKHDFVKLNFMFNGKDSLMNWYQESNDAISKDTFSPTGTPAEQFNKEDVKLIESATIGYPSLVQVGKPHDITNNLIEDRYVICLVPIMNGKRIPMNIALELFKPFIKVGVP